MARASTSNRPPIPPITNEGAVINWFLKHDKYLNGLRANFPDQIAEVGKDIRGVLIHAADDGRSLQSTVANISRFVTEFMPGELALYQRGGPYTDDEIKLLFACELAGAKIRILGYFLKEKHGIDPQIEYRPEGGQSERAFVAATMPPPVPPIAYGGSARRWVQQRLWSGLLSFSALSVVGASVIANSVQSFREHGYITFVMMAFVTLCMVTERGGWPMWLRIMFVPVSWLAHALLTFPVVITTGVVVYSAPPALVDRVTSLVAAIPIVLFAMWQSTFFTERIENKRRTQQNVASNSDNRRTGFSASDVRQADQIIGWLIVAGGVGTLLILALI